MMMKIINFQLQTVITTLPMIASLLQFIKVMMLTVIIVVLALTLLRQLTVIMAMAKKRHSQKNQATMFHQQMITHMPTLLKAIIPKTKEEHKTSTYVSHTVEQRMNLELIKLLDSMGCPDDGMNRVLKWADRANQLGYDFQPPRTTRKAQIEEFYKVFKLENLRPRTTIVPIRTNSPELPTEIDVVFFDFATMLLSVLTNPEIMNSDKLLINPEDFRKPYEGSEMVGEGLNALWYKTTCLMMRKSEMDFIVPINIFTDKTHVTSNGRFTLDPVLFVLGLLKDKVQKQSTVWRPLGFKQTVKMSSAQATKESANMSQNPAYNLHQQMRLIMQSLVDCQKHGTGHRLENVELTIAGQTRRCNIVVCVMNLEVDGQEKDRLCGRYLSYRSFCQRISSHCNQLTADCDSHKKLCCPNQASKMNDLIDNSTKQELQAYTLSKIVNAFREVCFGANLGGIYTACAPDLLHLFEHGLVKHVLQVLLQDELTETQRQKIDNVIMHYATTVFRQTVARDFFRVQFKNGITNLTNETAAERMGSLFTLLCVLAVSAVYEELETVWDEERYHSILNALEMMLCCHAFLRKDEFWKCPEAFYDPDFEDTVNDTGYVPYYECPEEEECLRSFEKMLKIIKIAVPRQTWCIQKFHEALHFPFFITNFGAPSRYSTQTGEHNHQEWAKTPGRKSRKEHKEFTLRAAERVVDAMVLDMVTERFERYERLTTTEKEPEEILNSLRGTRWTLELFDDIPTVYWHTETEEAMRLPSYLINFLCEKTDLEFPSVFHTELSRKGYQFRAHPNFNSQGCWNDWGMVNFSGERRVKIKKGAQQGSFKTETFEQCVPAKFECFFQGADGQYFAVVHPCAFEAKDYSVLMQKWELEFTSSSTRGEPDVPDLQIVSVDAIHSHVFVIPDSDKKTIKTVANVTEWPDKFC